MRLPLCDFPFLGLGGEIVGADVRVIKVFFESGFDAGTSVSFVVRVVPRIIPRILLFRRRMLIFLGVSPPEFVVRDGSVRVGVGM
jgi:hypothetical protein